MNKGLKNEGLFLLGLTTLGLLITRQKKAAFAVGGLTAAWALSKDKTQLRNFRGQSVVITGGSRGLGLAFAQELAREGALITLLARDENELNLAKDKILAQNSHADVHIYPCDVTKPSEITAALRDTFERRQGLDLLINNAGAILVGPFDSMTLEDFDAQMKLHLNANLYATKAVLPYFRAQRGGRILNICSMGGKAAVPHMLPYDTSKFALAGFSQGLSAELAPENIIVTTVYPTLMRTGSPIQAVFKGHAEKEFSWFATADNMPGLSQEASRVARAALKASREGRTEFIPSTLGRFRQIAAAFFPETVMATMALMNRLMPKGKSKLYKTGAQSENSRSYLPGISKRAHEAEEMWNQTPKEDPKYNIGLSTRH